MATSSSRLPSIGIIKVIIKAKLIACHSSNLKYQSTIITIFLAHEQVSSSSVQSQGESSSSRPDQEVTTGEVRAMLRSSPRVSSRGDESVSSAGFKRSRCDVEDDDGEQPGPSTKIAMVTSSAHVHHTVEVNTEFYFS